MAPLMRPHKVPRHPGLPGEEQRGFPAPLPLSPFYPPDLDRRVDSPALSKENITWDDWKLINGDGVPGKPWHCEVLLTALTEEINAPMQIDFSPYYMFDWWILNGRPMNEGKPYVGKLKEA